jgi:hypothetical protein
MQVEARLGFTQRLVLHPVGFAGKTMQVEHTRGHGQLLAEERPLINIIDRLQMRADWKKSLDFSSKQGLH